MYPDLFETVRARLGNQRIAVAMVGRPLNVDRKFPAARLTDPQALLQSRKNEFLLGRICASKAIEGLGVKAADVGVRSDGSPEWPESIVGSISHCNQCVIAIVAFAADYLSLGVDVEKEQYLDGSIVEYFCNRAELESLHYNIKRGISPIMLFSAKEAVLKMASKKLRLDLTQLSQIQITISDSLDEFTAQVYSDPWRNNKRKYNGIFIKDSGIVVSVAFEIPPT